ncbi:dynein regulatory complex subunit 3-like [Macrosteles quadrilineatus]|uniref:dynein regulatory complex subunit 3-like n=1 Tax=Macrosteles quadrilineatus TaxID=74068 RepID=UPI0023E2E994|nr:dynein regulatory complex subunit 3-like [Macrosteles quadrilineatus]
MELQNEDAWRPRPGVINSEMIKGVVTKMIKDDISGMKLDEEDDFDYKEIEQIYLEHLDITRIDHLWVMPALTVLKLTGNLIEKIENIDMLVNLVDLNLSFNKIVKIENLSMLKNLRHLSLFSNLITVIENLDHLENLKIFTIGNNKISDKQCILHLRNLNLFSLNMEGNPCSAESGFRNFIAAYLPKLRYYEYKVISEEERTNGRADWSTDLENLEREESEAAETIREERVQAEKEALYYEAFVEGLDKDQLFDAMFENDPNGQEMILLGEEIQEVYSKFKIDIGLATTEIFNLGVEQFDMRKKEIEEYKKGTEQAITQSRNKQKDILEKFIETKTNMFVDISNLLNILPQNGSDEDIRKSMEESVDRAMVAVATVKKELLNLEQMLSEQLKEVFSTFERSLGDMVSFLIESAQGHFTNMREYETLFSEQMGDYVSRYQTQMTIRNEDINNLPPTLRPIMADKETINTAVATSHDVHLQIIDSREDQLMSRARGWYTKICQDYENQEEERFRGRVYEIITFLEIQAADFQQFNLPIDEDLLVQEMSQE